MKRINVAFIILSMVMVLPVLYYSMLSIPYADDFSCAREALEYSKSEGNYLLGALYGTRRYWIEFQGSYTGIFLVLFLNAFARWGLIGLRVFNTICMVLFYVSMLLLVNRFVSSNDNKSKLLIPTFLIVLFWSTNNYIYSEVYTWNNVIVIYIIPLIFTFLGEALYIDYVRNQNYLYILAALVGIVIGGGTINIATLGCGLYFLTACYGLIQAKVDSKVKLFTPVAVAIVATLVNVLAPGNFVRWDGVNDDVNILLVLSTAFLNVIKRIWQLSIGTPFVVLAVIIFVVVFNYCDYNFDGKLSYKHPVALAIILLLGATLVNFPYVLGVKFQSINETFQDRGLFVQDITIYLLLVVWIYYFAAFLRTKLQNFKFNKSHYRLIVMALMTNVLLIVGDNGVNLGTPYMISTIFDGSAHDYSDYQEELMEKVEHGDDEVVIWYDTKNHSKTDRIIIGLRLGDVEGRWDYWHNTTMANYYGKKLLRVIYGE